MKFLCIMIFDIDLNTTAAGQKYTFLGQLLSFINMQELENSLVLTHNQWKDETQSSVVLQ